jgi:hypothetical protein
MTSLAHFTEIHIPLDRREILNVNLMAHDNRGPIFHVPQSILQRSDNHVFETGCAGSIRRNAQFVDRAHKVRSLTQTKLLVAP